MSLLQGRWVEDYTLSERKIKFQNDQFLLGRDAADAVDLQMFKIDLTDELEFGIQPVYQGSTFTPKSLITKEYAEQLIFGLRDPKDACQAATVGNIDLSSAVAAYDSVTMVADFRILVHLQTDPVENGIYKFVAVGSPLVRTEDFDENAEVTTGASTLVNGGATYNKASFAVTTPDPIVVGSSAIIWAQVPSLGNLLVFRDILITLNATDISNGYVDLAHAIQPESIHIAPKGGLPQAVGDDYSISLPTVVSRITFAGDLGLYLQDADKVIVKYSYEP